MYNLITIIKSDIQIFLKNKQTNFQKTTLVCLIISHKSLQSLISEGCFKAMN